ncbi:MAG TPA: PHP domain-containing protein [Candidatus Saccharimonadales bacterium]|nr:PHP domain-containing protein [Candidatus Saccharimonadales bacterium]
MYKIDLHTHSVASPDGSLTLEHYRRMLAAGQLDYIAITDHNRIDFALAAHAELGQAIIVGEEITTQQGEVIGLFLERPVPAGLPLAEAVQCVRAQHGLVYVPHPFETLRSGVQSGPLDSIAPHVDVLETYNGRALFQNKSREATAWAAAHRKPGAASSDAHGRRGWGRTYSIIGQPPTAQNLARLLQSAHYQRRTVGLIGGLYPKYNRLRKAGRRYA